MKVFSLAAAVCAAALATGFVAPRPARPTAPAPPKKYNVLFIASDDLNDDMGSFGNPLVKTPNLDQLLKHSVRFDRAYNQYPLCGPSRASLLTGYRPDKTGVADLTTQFRQALPNAVTLPQLFKNNGYFSGRSGKIFHYGVPRDIGTNGLDDSLSWNERVNPYGRDKVEQAKIINVTPKRALGSALAYLAADGTDEEQTDGMVASAVIKMMKTHHQDPFFLAAGFFRPHCPYVAPKKYFDMYPLSSIKLPEERADDWADKPAAAAYTTPLNWDVPAEQRREATRAYYASISFMDAQVGRLLHALDSLKLRDNTIIVFWSDHGYSLGQHGQWMKETLFEHVARTPLIVSVPGVTEKGSTSSRLVEMVDIYPTLAQLCGLKAPTDLQGTSLLPLLQKPAATWQRPAYTQILRVPGPFWPEVKKRLLGRSVRTERYRYTEWNEGADGLELYDYQTDPNEFHNLAHNPAQAARVRELAVLLHKSYTPDKK